MENKGLENCTTVIMGQNKQQLHTMSKLDSVMRDKRYLYHDHFSL